MQEHHEGMVTILSEADEEAIGRKLNELMEVVWDTFQRRRLLLRSPQRRRKARLTQPRENISDSSPLDLLF